jgi:D-3-phosphoglycerate dehydrogenase
MARILITDPNFGTSTDSIDRLKAAGHEPVRGPYPISEEQYLTLIVDADALVAGPDPISPLVIERAKKLKLITRFGVGIDNIDIGVATKHRVIVTNAGGANRDAVADFVFLLMLALSRDFSRAAGLVKRHEWRPLRGVDVWQKTLGVIGTGHIGKRVIRSARGFEMNVLAYDIVRDSSLVGLSGVDYVSMKELLESSDFVTVHVPRLPGTIGLIGETELRQMKSTAYLINTARGRIVDEQALCRALKERWIAGAALDVFAEEPPKPSELLEMDNLIATPHIASSTVEAIQNVDRVCLENLLRVLGGDEPVNAVNYPFEE